MTFTERVCCPNCGADSGTRVRNSADICRCDECGLVYLRTRPPVGQMEKFYATYHSNPGSHMALPKTTLEVKQSGLRRDYFLREILEFKGVSRGLFTDLGAGWGAFLDNARDNGFDVRGNEICDGMAHFARTRLKIPVWSAQLEDCPFGDVTTSVVTALHSLEHLPNQKTAMFHIRRILHDGGLFCGIVPNFASFMSDGQGDKWHWIDSNFHYVQFEPETLKIMLRSFGFEPLRIYTATDDFDPKLINEERRRQNETRPIQQLEADGKGEAIRFFARKET